LGYGHELGDDGNRGSGQHEHWRRESEWSREPEYKYKLGGTEGRVRVVFGGASDRDWRWEGKRLKNRRRSDNVMIRKHYVGDWDRAKLVLYKALFVGRRLLYPKMLSISSEIDWYGLEYYFF
jgi:hypothetical protein